MAGNESLRLSTPSGSLARIDNLIRDEDFDRWCEQLKKVSEISIRPTNAFIYKNENIYENGSKTPPKDFSGTITFKDGNEVYGYNWRYWQAFLKSYRNLQGNRSETRWNKVFFDLVIPEKINGASIQEYAGKAQEKLNSYFDAINSTIVTTCEEREKAY